MEQFYEALTPVYGDVLASSGVHRLLDGKGSPARETATCPNTHNSQRFRMSIPGL